MGTLIDLTDKSFGRLTVIERAPNDRYGRAVWRCRCEACGSIRLYPSNRLRMRGATKCRSCANRERGARPGYPLPFDLLTYNGAHRRMAKLLPMVCAHCGATNGRLEVAFSHDTPPQFRRVSKRGLVYSSREEDYLRSCARCHRRYDHGHLRIVRLVQTDLELAA